MNPETYEARLDQIRRKSKLMTGSQSTKDRWIAEQTEKLNLEAGKIACLPTPKKTPTPAGYGKIEMEDKGGFWEGRCPACAEEGKDSTGNHLRVYADGWPVCMANRGDSGKEHRARIRAILKLKNWQPRPVADTAKEEAELKAKYATLWAKIREELSGNICDLGQSGEIPADPEDQFLVWVKQCYQPGDLLWGGTRGDWSEASREADRISGKEKEYPGKRSFARHCFLAEDAVAAWGIIQWDGCDHTSGAVWKDTLKGRMAGNVACHRLLCVEHDDADFPAQIALWRYCQRVLKLDLLAVVDTTNKGGHGHFDATGISAVRLREIISTLKALGADPNVLERSSTRIPGAIRQKDWQKPEKPFGGVQSLLWIKPQH